MSPPDEPADPRPEPAPGLLDEAGGILADAEGLSGSELEAFLARECAGRDDLRRLIDSLLADMDAARDFLGEGPGTAMRARLESDLAAESARTPPVAGAAIGSYRIVRAIAAGGMGTVYEAEQTNPRRRVALKLIAPGMATPDVLKRFRLEGELLARLSHPGIAKVLEVSPPDAPEPWFAMELVDGMRLTDHAEALRLTIHDRLVLLAATCDAVAHAHSRGIVHRDLKPSNILVDSAGHPRVLDFGVARATGLEDSTSMLLTRTGDLVGTLAYMSPEQAWGRHEAVDARSDVYSLGVIGFQMLTGRLPRRLENLSIGEALHVLREGEPERADSIDPRLAGDVATLLAKALEAEPSRRYASAAEFAADIRRCLRDEPIVARPPSMAYRATKFLRRHRTLALTTAAAFVLLAIVAAMAMRAAMTASRASRVAAREAYRANLAAAASEMELGSFAAARLHLDAVPAAQRAWEWRVLSARAAGPTASLPLRGVRAIACARDGAAAYLLAGDPAAARVVAVSLPDLRTTAAYDLSARPLTVPDEILPFVVRDLLSGDGATWSIVPASPAGAPPRDIKRPASATPDVSAVSDEARLAVMATGPNRWGVFDLRSGTLLRELAGTRPALFDRAGERLAWTQVTAVGAADARTGGRAFMVESAALAAAEPAGAKDDGFMSAAFSSDGKLLYAGSYGAGARVRSFDALTGALVAQSRVQAATAWSADAWAVAAGGSRAAWSPGDGSIHVFDATLQRELGVAHLTERQGLGSIALSPDGSQLVGVAADGVHAWDLAVALMPRVLEAHGSYVYAVSFSPDGRQFVTAGWDLRVRTWDAETMRMLLDIPFGSDGAYPTDAAFTPDGTRLVMVRGDNTLRVADAATGSTLGERRVAERSTDACVSLSPAGDLALVAQPDGAVVVVRLQDLAPVPGFEGLTRAGAFSPDGRVLAAGLSDGGAALIDLAAGARRPLELPDSRVLLRRLRWSPDGKRLAAALGDGTVQVIDAASGRRMLTLGAPGSGETYDAVVSPDGTRIASGSGDGAVRVWDADGGELLATWPGHGLYVHGLAFSPDGRVLLSASGDRTVRRWDSRDERERAAPLATRR